MSRYLTSRQQTSLATAVLLGLVIVAKNRGVADSCLGNPLGWLRSR